MKMDGGGAYVATPLVAMYALVVDDPKGRIHADNYGRHVCATRGACCIWNALCGVVYSDDPKGRIHADNYGRHVCATRYL